MIASVQLCGFTGPRMSYFEIFFSCMGWGAQSGRQAGETSANETNGRTQDVIACEVRNTATPPPPPASVRRGCAAEMARLFSASSRRKITQSLLPILSG